MPEIINFIVRNKKNIDKQISNATDSCVMGVTLSFLPGKLIISEGKNYYEK